MNHALTLPDSAALDDLATYLGRAGRVEDGSVRLIAAKGVLAVYVAIFYPSGLLDESPTVLGLRTFALPGDEAFDAVVPVGSLLQRLKNLQQQVTDASAPVAVTLPLEVHTVSWAAISPPRSGWAPLDPTSGALLDAAARAGIEEIATAIPTGTGEQIVHRVRSQVWSRPIDGLDHVPAGAGFAALSLGFLGGDDTVRIFETGPWTRLTTRRGHVLTKRRSWSLNR
jgi:hypothetical protein